MALHTRSKLVGLLLIPAIVLAQLLCLCAGATAAPPQQAPAVVEKALHGCCEEGDVGKAPAREHDENCPHCTSEGQAQADVARGSVAASTAFLNFIAPVWPAILVVSADASAARSVAFAHWLTDPSPPPDLLRVKCSLQI